MTKLHISPTLSLPADAVTSTIVVYGGKGMGKTNLGGVLVEEFASAGQRFAVIDPMGVWWGLPYSASGKGVGVKVLVLGGIHGHLPIAPDSGALVADLVAESDDNIILDISRRPDGSMWAIAERIRFVRDYLKRIYQRQGERRRPLNQVIDEAARFAPQVVRSGEMDVAQCMGAVAVVVEEGRNVGIGVTLITQRSARLNKDVAELADCMIAFRTVGPNSMRAVLDWLGEHVEKSRLKDMGEKLRSLPRGSALVVSPGWLEFEGVAAMRKRTTFDSSATPEDGEPLKPKGRPADIDVESYRDKLGKIVEEQKANDPKALKARVVELETQLAARVKPAPAAKVEIKTVEKPIVTDKVAKSLADSVTRIERRIVPLGDELKDVAGELAAVKAVLHAAPWKTPSVLTPMTRPQVVAALRAGGEERRLAERPAAIVRRDPKPVNGDALAIGGGLKRIMVALAQHPDGLSDRQVGMFAGLSSKGGTYSTYISRARQAGYLVDTRRGERAITEAGLAALGDFEPLPTGAELAKYWLRETGGGEARILQVLLDAGRGVEVDSKTIAERAGISASGGTFSTYISRLRTRELITGSRGVFAASEELFS